MFVLRIVNVLPIEERKASGLSNQFLRSRSYRAPVPAPVTSLGLYMAVGNWVSFHIDYSYRGFGLRNSAVRVYAPVAQRIEHLPSKQGVAGSSPAGRILLPITYGQLSGCPFFLVCLLVCQLPKRVFFRACRLPFAAYLAAHGCSIPVSTRYLRDPIVR
jgi:hypothetical protein